ncbi:MAG: hydantoinase B/oxoprolinase family protein [Deltaproteobacteria bacterium]|nr:hydantoinase B/oxoprolinase family protein [Deltaproteobacteria bacterium]
MNNNKKWKFAVDRGGTFTDIVGIDPEGCFHTSKLLSSSPAYSDASIEGIRRVMGIRGNGPLPEERIGEIRFGTTVATNALLERKGGRVGLVITKGFADLIEIGYQARPDIFSLAIKKPSILYSKVIEVDERIDSEGKVVKNLDSERLSKAISEIKGKVDTVAVVLMHSWRNAGHELLCRDILKRHGIKEVFLSHRTMNLIKIVSRGQSCVVDAYLSPVIHKYLDGIREATGNIPIEFIQSSGTLSHPDNFLGKDAILSGPAGGVIGVASITAETGLKGVIGFDMGGTSTDVSRYDGEPDKVYERIIEGIELQKEMLNINAVAAGGGSILSFDGRRMLAGPESAGADPGPACYGFGGPLTVTDANLITGRIALEYFPKTFGPERNAPLDAGRARALFEELSNEINAAMGASLSAEDTANGFLRIANEKMALAIKEISLSKGLDVRHYALVCFGGAGGQHACQLASLLGMKKIIFHPLGGVMSAYGIGLAKPDRKSDRTVLMELNRENHKKIEALLDEMESQIMPSSSGGRAYLAKRETDIRPKGTDSYITVKYGAYDEILTSFMKKHEQLFGFHPEDSPLEVVNLRIRVSEEVDFFPPYRENKSGRRESANPISRQEVIFPHGKYKADMYLRESLPPGRIIEGPAMILDKYSTLIIDPGFTGEVMDQGIISLTGFSGKKEQIKAEKSPDPILLEVFNNLFMNISTEMGHTLRNTAHSVNIKERLDFSCALFDSKGELVANAPHIPVHLGSMSDAVKGVMAGQGTLIQRGHIYLTNDPYNGGSHLPDITAVCPIFSAKGEIIFFTAARGHHADIGGTTPGSMPPGALHIDEEGVLIKNMLIVKEGRFMEEEARGLLTSGKYPARNMDERISDLRAQVAACHKGREEIERLVNNYGLATVKSYMNFIQQNAGFSIKKALSTFLAPNTPFEASFKDLLDDGSPIAVNIKIKPGNNPPESIRCIIDFTGTGSEHKSDNLNAPLSVTRSAVLYVLRSLIKEDIPLNSGCLKPIRIIVPEGSLLNPAYPSPVASGNVETSQRIVDVLLGAFGVAAASQGTMNNFIFQVEGDTPYYETIAGGSGAMAGHDGASGVQVHMTNTRMTDPEILEVRHPDVRLERFSLREGSGGAGRFRGGDGLIRELTFLKAAEVSLISERRTYPPYGIAGGMAAKKGRNLVRKNGMPPEEMESRFNIKLGKDTSVIIETPGGGGYGEKLP